VSKVQIQHDTYQLLTNAAATGAGVGPVRNGTYIWALAGTVGGATIKLQTLGPDGATYLDVTGASMTAVGQMQVIIGEGAVVRAVVTGGAPSALYSNLT
jgi:hypothetical protein